MTVKRNAALGFIFVTLLIDVIGFGIIIPVMPKLIEQLTGEGLSGASQYAGWLTFAYAITQFILSPVVGALSDRYGRRPVLLCSLMGFCLDYIFLAFAPTIQLLFVGRIIAGITGASMSTATAYIADISTPEKRSQNFGMIGVAFGLGFIIGPGLGALFSHWGPRVPFMAAAVLSFLNFLYGFFVLPESLLPENRRAFEWKRANAIGSLKNLRRYPVIAGLIISLVLVYIAGYAVQSTWNFYTMEKFHWTESWVGYSLMFVGVMVALVQGGLIRIIIPKIGQKKSVIIGLILYTIGYILFAFATQGWMMFAFLVPYCLGGICGPALQGIMSSQVPANEQGELQGALTSLMSVTMVIGPLFMTNMFTWFTRTGTPVYFPGAPFIAGGFLLVTGTVLAAISLSGFRFARANR
ncbi:DHA1 family tetracycline resistance protein-like MFS transporter [Chitinophaga niastensis]|uniref:DHA1 family tetracycline resistance protein-like MFS transporter n=1 Tax=Chitinophaga niastensis TaxID=536980 RepID=A0A2P8HB73_CHINA|nr:TCR/Tet family MFS transporter [Chitinophaga niastensis]PSL43473.1 DHA1 family tetracycline resistance protein-like MFS transporter [Chitinophaga niastensis]